MTIDLPFLSGPNDIRAIVAERFISFQGEGPLAGQRCAFIRFSRCNLSCGYCDTKQTWDWSRYHPSEVSTKESTAELIDWVRGSGVDLLVLTGGEPMLQQPSLTALARGCGARVQVETNGTIVPTPELVDRVDLWVVSPKLANSGVPQGKRIVPAALAALAGTGRAAFKFVVTGIDDFDEIAELAAAYELRPIWVMPEGETVQAIVEGMALLHQEAVARGWNISARLHILAGAR